MALCLEHDDKIKLILDTMNLSDLKRHLVLQKASLNELCRMEEEQDLDEDSKNEKTYIEQSFDALAKPEWSSDLKTNPETGITLSGWQQLLADDVKTQVALTAGGSDDISVMTLQDARSRISKENSRDDNHFMKYVTNKATLTAPSNLVIGLCLKDIPGTNDPKVENLRQTEQGINDIEVCAVR